MADKSQAQRRRRITIVSPASARENNGNWQTASRWAYLLGTAHDVSIVHDWHDGDAVPDLLIALHARRAAPALAAFAQACPATPTVLVLTGTDLYRDIAVDAAAQASLDTAQALVLLQPAGLALLPLQAAAKARVIYQSAPSLAPLAPSTPPFTISMIGHLRAEKDPATFMRASALLAHREDIRCIHIGGALEADLGQLAASSAAANPHYRWLGNLPHADTREALRASHAMVIASTMEGGANVIIEAVTCGVPVIASDISGNRGMLGDDYPASFAVGDAHALAALIARSIDDAPWYASLQAACAARAALFAPAAEQAALLQLVDNLVDQAPQKAAPSPP